MLLKFNSKLLYYLQNYRVPVRERILVKIKKEDYFKSTKDIILWPFWMEVVSQDSRY